MLFNWFKCFQCVSHFLIFLASLADRFFFTTSKQLDRSHGNRFGRRQPLGRQLGLKQFLSGSEAYFVFTYHLVI